MSDQGPRPGGETRSVARARRARGPQPQSIRIPRRGAALEARLYPAVEPQACVLLGGGVGGGFDTPARGLYHRLGEELPKQGLSVLWIQYRQPTDLDEAIQDVLLGIGYLVSHGCPRVGLVGHSFGGAVMIGAAARSPKAATVVALAPQSFGTEEVGSLTPRPLLLVHGTADSVLPSSCSRSIYEHAQTPKALELIEGTGHVLDEASERVHALVHDWLVKNLLRR